VPHPGANASSSASPDRPGNRRTPAGLHVESGGEVSGERGALPVNAPSRDVDSRLSSPLEHVGGTQLSLRSISCQLRNAINQTVDQ
jgi:hypothetical protein